MSASIQVLTRAIQPLEILTRKDAPMCLAEIAEASGLPKSSAYPVSKAGLIMFTKCLAVEYAAEGIRANAFCPGQLLTDMNVKRYAREAAAEGCTPEETMRRAIATVPARTHRHAPRCGPCRRVPRFGRFRLHDRAGAERHRGKSPSSSVSPSPKLSDGLSPGGRFPRFSRLFFSVFRASSTSKRRAAQ